MLLCGWSAKPLVTGYSPRRRRFFDYDNDSDYDFDGKLRNRVLRGCGQPSYFAQGIICKGGTVALLSLVPGSIYPTRLRVRIL
jgi:hypothetical protein